MPEQSKASPARDGDLPNGSDSQPVGDLTSRVSRVAAPVREQVLQLLHQEIVEMRLQPGQRLVERELIERIGVSRTTIREVLRQLSAEGLVTTIPQKGAIVAIPSAKDASEVYEVRALLEGVLARHFAEHASDEQVAALRSAFTEMARRSGESEDPREVLRAKADLYEVLFDGAENRTVRDILESFQARIAVMRAATLSEPGRAAESVEEIETLVEAIERRDADAAERASRHHVEQAASTLFRSAILSQSPQA